jgi:hypothetical protein
MADEQPSPPITEERLIELLRNHLRLDVRTESEYMGSLGDGDGSLYKDYHTVSLWFDDIKLSEISL